MPRPQKIFSVATLYLSGTPVKPLDDPEYQITATAVGGKLIADYCVLRNISWNELKAQGF